MEDIDECTEMDNVCKNGRCSNTFGSFMCTCNDGYQIDDANALCLDIDECLQDPLICGVGSCVNTDGGYNCICPEGYVLLPGGSGFFGNSLKLRSYINFDNFFRRGVRRYAKGTLLHELHEQRLRQRYDATANSNGLLLFDGRCLG